MLRKQKQKQKEAEVETSVANAQRVELTFTILSVDFVPADKKWDPEHLSVEIKRNQKLFSTKRVTLALDHKKTDAYTIKWDEDIAFGAQLSIDPATKAIGKKEYKLSFEDVREKKGQKSLASAVVDISNLVDPFKGTTRTHTLMLEATSTKVKDVVLKYSLSAVLDTAKHDDNASIISTATYKTTANVGAKGNDSSDDEGDKKDPAGTASSSDALSKFSIARSLSSRFKREDSTPSAAPAKSTGDVSGEVEKLKAEIAHLNASFEEKEKLSHQALDSVSAQLTASNKEVDRLKEALAKAEKSGASASAAGVDATKVAQLEKDLQKAHQEKDEATRKVRELENDIASLRTLQDTARVEHETREKALNVKLSVAQSEREACEAKLADLRAERDKLSTEKVTLLLAHEDQVARLNSELDNVRTQVSQLETRSFDSDQQIAQLRIERADEHRKAEELTTRVHTLEDELAESRKEHQRLAELQSSVDGTSLLLDKLREELHASKAAAEASELAAKNAIAERAEADATVASIQQQLQELRVQNVEQSQTLALLKQQLEQSSKDSDVSRKALEDAHAELQTIKESLATATSACDGSAAELTAAKIENVDLRAKLDAIVTAEETRIERIKVLETQHGIAQVERDAEKLASSQLEIKVASLQAQPQQAQALLEGDVKEQTRIATERISDLEKQLESARKATEAAEASKIVAEEEHRNAVAQIEEKLRAAESRQLQEEAMLQSDLEAKLAKSLEHGSDLEAKLAKSVEDLAKANEKCAAAESQVVQSEKRINELESQLAEAAMQRTTLEARLAESEQQIGDSLQRASLSREEADSKTTALSADLAVAQQRAERLEKDVSEKEEKLLTLETAAKSQRDLMEAQIASLQAEKDAFIKERESLRIELSKAQEELAAILAERSAKAESSLAQNEAELRELKSLLSSQKQEVEELQASLRQLTSERSVLSEDLDASSTKNKELEKEIKELQEKLEHALQESLRAKEQAGSVATDAEASLRKVEAQLQETQQTHKKLIVRLAEIVGESFSGGDGDDEIAQSVQALHGAKAGVEAELRRLEGKLAQVQAELEESQENHATFRRRNAELEAELDRLQSARTAAAEEATSTAAAAAADSQALASARDQIAALERQLAETVVSSKATQAKLAEEEQERTASQLAATNIVADSLRKELEELRSTLAELHTLVHSKPRWTRVSNTYADDSSNDNGDSGIVSNDGNAKDNEANEVPPTSKLIEFVKSDYQDAAAARKALTTLQKELNKDETSMADLESQLSVLASQLEELSKENERLDQDLETQENENKRLREKVDASAAEEKRLLAEVAAWQSKAEDLAGEFADLDALKSERKLLRSELDDALARIEGLQTELDVARKGVSEATVAASERASSQRQDITSITAEVASLKAEKEDLVTRLAETRDQIWAIEDRNRDLAEQNDRLVAERDRALRDAELLRGGAEEEGNVWSDVPSSSSGGGVGKRGNAVAGSGENGEANSVKIAELQKEVEQLRARLAASADSSSSNKKEGEFHGEDGDEEDEENSAELDLAGVRLLVEEMEEELEEDGTLGKNGDDANGDGSKSLAERLGLVLRGLHDKIIAAEDKLEALKVEREELQQRQSKQTKQTAHSGDHDDEEHQRRSSASSTTAAEVSLLRSEIETLNSQHENLFAEVITLRDFKAGVERACQHNSNGGQQGSQRVLTAEEVASTLEALTAEKNRIEEDLGKMSEELIQLRLQNAEGTFNVEAIGQEKDELQKKLDDANFTISALQAKIAELMNPKHPRKK